MAFVEQQQGRAPRAMRSGLGTVRSGLGRRKGARARPWPLAAVRSPPPLHLDRVTFGYVPSSPILRQASLTVHPGTLHFLLGLNGCGKSTLLRVINGMVVPQSGGVVFGRVGDAGDPSGVDDVDDVADVADVDDVADVGIGYVFQNPDDQVCMPTVYSDVGLALGKYEGLGKRDADLLIRHALAQVNMLEYVERQSSSLSGGQKQRVAIAGAMVEHPAILLLDELTTFLDGSDQMNVLKAVRRIVTETGITAVWVTHRLEELAYADAVSYMEDGRVVWTVDAQEAKRKMQRMGAYVV
jgi:energy-coupling factor transport system ATP-binding protein